MNKKAQFDFVWIFALIAGGAILALAIFGAMKAGDTQRYQSDTETAKSLSSIIDKIQSGFSMGDYGKVTFRQETRINNLCLDDNYFGKNELSLATRSNVGEEWNLVAGASSLHDKYIFSKTNLIGEEYYIFSLPYSFPYKTSEITILITDKYCLLNPPKELEEFSLRAAYPFLEVNNCSENSKKVCFGTSNCDISVYGLCTSNCESPYDMGKIIKNGQEMKYAENLMWAAIFSDKGIYDCNVNRLLYRTGKIGEILVEKADLMDARNCNTNLKADTYLFSTKAINSSVDELFTLYDMSKNLKRMNEREICGLWE